jgi:hypothetical protein
MNVASLQLSREESLRLRGQPCQARAGYGPRRNADSLGITRGGKRPSRMYAAPMGKAEAVDLLSDISAQRVSF